MIIFFKRVFSALFSPVSRSASFYCASLIFVMLLMSAIVLRRALSSFCERFWAFSQNLD